MTVVAHLNLPFEGKRPDFLSPWKPGRARRGLDGHDLGKCDARESKKGVKRERVRVRHGRKQEPAEPLANLKARTGASNGEALLSARTSLAGGRPRALTPSRPRPAPLADPCTSRPPRR